MTTETRTCQNCKKEFVIEPDDFAFYEKIKVPPPTFCPDCRMQRRMAFRNERTLYKTTCGLCGKAMLSMYSPDKPIGVYCKECWLGDGWDPLSYGVDYDFSTPFFVQWRTLMERVPKIGIAYYHTNVNADYANFIADDKNVYLAYSIIESENVYYSRSIDNSKDCFDSFQVEHGEMIYETVDGGRNYRTRFLFRSRECLNSAFLFDCVNCQDCFMSSNLRNKRYMIRNVQYDKAPYEEEMKKINMGSFAELKKLKEEYTALVPRSLHKYANLVKTTNCSGDNIENAKNSLRSFDAYDSENIKFAVRIIASRDSYDLTGSGRSELLYECVAGGYGSYGARFSTFLDATRAGYYSDWCHHSSNVFGCFGVRKKQYCILNKQYSKEAYETLVPNIIAHMAEMPYEDKNGRRYAYGEFPPVELSPFAYNETIAQEYFPLTKEEALAQGYAWHDPDPYPHKPTMRAGDLPDDIKDVQDSIVHEVIGCPDCKRAYRIIQPELDFLRGQGISLPRKCPDCRYKDRFVLRNPLQLWHRQCACLSDETLAKADAYKNTATHFHGNSKCPNEFETPYAPERKETVYCEQCYNAEIA